MERGKTNYNTILGLLLIAAIFITYNYFNAPEPVAEEVPNEQAIDSAEVVEETRELLAEQDSVIPPDSLKKAELYGPFVQGKESEASLITIENDVLELQFSPKGAQLMSARLKNYQTWDTLPLYLIKESSAHNLNLEYEGKVYNTADLQFVPKAVTKNSVRFEITTQTGSSLSYSYSLEPTDYMLNWSITSDGLGAMVQGNTGLEWKMVTLRHEKNLETEGQKTSLEYFESPDQDLEELSATGEDEEASTQVRWVAAKQQFFSTILFNKEKDFKSANLYSLARDGDKDFTKDFLSRVEFSTPGRELNADFGLYLGPNKYEIMAAYEQEFEKLIPLGWGILGWINRGIVINIFNWLEGYGLSYGLIILIIALFIKIIIFPLTFTSYKSMAKMRVLKPEIDALNEKYKDKDAMQKQQATMELYRKAGVNPLGGCIPVLLQMPILIALFNFFPSSIELRQQSFLWASDLSTYDSIYELPFNIPFYGDHVSLFTLLMTVSTLLYTWMNQQVTGQNQQYPQMKYLVYLMPVVFLGVFNNYAAGLSYYYFLANMITFGQQFAIRAYIDEDKIHAKMQEKKQAPVKENRLMRRMRELQEQQERTNRKTRRK